MNINCNQTVAVESTYLMERASLTNLDKRISSFLFFEFNN
jgi:hypothetical protein